VPPQKPGDLLELAIGHRRVFVGAFLLFVAASFLLTPMLGRNFFPAVDGGQILMNVAEGIKGSAFSTRTREYIMRAGLVAIALLFALVMFNDVKGLVGIFR